MKLLKRTIIQINNKTITYAAEIVDFVTDEQNELTTIAIGSQLPFFTEGKLRLGSNKYRYDNSVFHGISSKSDLLKTAFTYLNAPFLWGGKTPFGIDCSGFTQMVYKLCGLSIIKRCKTTSYPR